MATLIPTDQIRAGDNDRKYFDADKLRELADNIAAHGLAQPPTVRPIYQCACGRQSWQAACACGQCAASPAFYEIVCGERRTRAMRDVLGWTEIPCEVRPMDDPTASAIMLAENVARVNLNPIEEANGYFARMRAYNYSVADVARIAGVKISDVQDALRLLKLAEDVQHFVAVGQLPMPYALLVCDLDFNRQRIAMRVYNKAQHMPMWKWRVVVSNLEQAQAQEHMLPFFEEMLIDTVNNASPRTGRKAITGAPVSEELPPVRYRTNEVMAETFERYILDLQASGLNTAASAVANIYTQFVARGIVNVPKLPTLDQSDAPAGDCPMVRLD